MAPKGTEVQLWLLKGLMGEDGLLSEFSLWASCEEKGVYSAVMAKGKRLLFHTGTGNLWLQEGRLKQGHAHSSLGKRRPYGLLATATSPEPPMLRGNPWGHLLRGSEPS